MKRLAPKFTVKMLKVSNVIKRKATFGELALLSKLLK